MLVPSGAPAIFQVQVGASSREPPRSRDRAAGPSALQRLDRVLSQSTRVLYPDRSCLFEEQEACRVAMVHKYHLSLGVGEISGGLCALSRDMGGSCGTLIWAPQPGLLSGRGTVGFGGMPGACCRYT